MVVVVDYTAAGMWSYAKEMSPWADKYERTLACYPLSHKFQKRFSPGSASVTPFKDGVAYVAGWPHFMCHPTGQMNVIDGVLGNGGVYEIWVTKPDQVGTDGKPLYYEMWVPVKDWAKVDIVKKLLKKRSWWAKWLDRPVQSYKTSTTTQFKKYK